MDFSTHGRQPAPGPNTNRFTSADSQPVVTEPNKPNKQPGNGRTLWIRVALVVFLLCLVALIVALLLMIGYNKPADEKKYVNTSGYQTVEVANTDGKAPTYYFGKLTDITSDYLLLTNASVLTSSPSDQAVNVAPLNCVGPNATSQLVFNRSQVIFWDNLDSGSATAQAISQLASNSSACGTKQTTSQPSTTSSTQPTTNPSGTSAGSQLPSNQSQPSTSDSTSSSSSSSSKPTSDSSTGTGTSTNPSAPTVP